VLLSDNQLLRRFVQTRSNSDFAELVQRHISMVYSTALRKTSGNSALADDVTQQVFIDLSAKAQKLLDHTSLASWLHRSTCFAAAKAMRGEIREHAKIQANAHLMEVHQQEPSSAEWEALAPHLDDAMEVLPEPDRQAVLLRFFEKRSFRDVGSELGVSEDAARKRVDRALDHLRAAFLQRGLSMTSAALTTGLTAGFFAAAPPVLATAICQSAAIAVSSHAFEAVTFFAMTKMKAGVAVLVLGAAVAIPVLQHKKQVVLKDRLMMQQQHLAARIAPPTQYATPERQRFLSQPQPDQSELLRLRAEVTALRRQLGAMKGAINSAEENEALRKRLGGEAITIETTSGTPFAPNRYYAAELWSDVGSDSPEGTLQTAIAAIKSGNIDRLLEISHWPTNQTQEIKDRINSYLSPQAIQKLPWAESIGVKIESFGGTLSSPDIHYIVIFDHGNDLGPVRSHFYVDNVNGNWRLGRIIAETGKSSEDYLFRR
jgi:RNA polymerase sigma factor (sigma-70 family)